MPRRPADGYDPIAIVLHWLIATLIVGLLVLGFVMTRQSIDPALQFSLFQWHKSFGMLALLLAAVRLIHSLTVMRVTPVEGLSALERLSADAVHYLLMILAVVVPVAGWMIASVSPLEIPTFAFNLVVIPHLPVPKSDAAEALWTTIHAVLAYSTLALVLLHSGAALYHHYVRHDDALTRMLGNRHRAVKTSIEEQGP
ncbi:Di-heme cytochrome, transmembrane [Rhizobium sp. CF080]|uniref:cytochrome b n=1 Tax=Rhizobium sp. (strain CF080) TaxID=1144310 RepID=UPI000271AC3C|nr:cytochrome b [Rhizobium sp. CF080]EUC01340.1 Di-heme cytochrome, transmembrane [Rhizobium sp. CF080]